jgi:4-hydroxybenzoate polyprenyltransferase
LTAYIVLNALYSLGLKRPVILDVMMVASGFALRSTGGAFVVGVKPSEWLLTCTFLLALFISFGKRRQELTTLGPGARRHRVSLGGYSRQVLDLMMASTAAAVLVTYSIYTIADDTVSRLGSRFLVITIPPVCYGLFRYLYLVHKKSGGGDPAQTFLSDRPMVFSAILWIATVCAIIY